jgi:hypothetical protein
MHREQAASAPRRCWVGTFINIHIRFTLGVNQPLERFGEQGVCIGFEGVQIEDFSSINIE